MEDDPTSLVLASDSSLTSPMVIDMLRLSSHILDLISLVLALIPNIESRSQEHKIIIQTQTLYCFRKLTQKLKLSTLTTDK